MPLSFDADTEPNAATPWYIAGCGCMGTLAAAYLQAAGWPVVVLREHGPQTQRSRLCFAARNEHREITLPVRRAADCPRVKRLVVACKTPYTRAALARIDLAEDAVIWRLQNGMPGSAWAALGTGQRRVDIVTRSAVRADAPGTMTVVAENDSIFGSGAPPADWPRLAEHWPGAQWQADIRFAQWRKLVVNAAINPLTALYDIPNGALLEDSERYGGLIALADEADSLLGALDDAWPGGSREAVATVARATAGNTSSMRADMQAGAVTEIEAINGWLISKAREIGQRLPAHEAIAARVRARQPTSA